MTALISGGFRASILEPLSVVLAVFGASAHEHVRDVVHGAVKGAVVTLLRADNGVAVVTVAKGLAFGWGERGGLRFGPRVVTAFCQFGL